MNDSQRDIGDRDNAKEDHILKQHWAGCIQPDPVFNHQGGLTFLRSVTCTWGSRYCNTLLPHVLFYSLNLNLRLLISLCHAFWPHFPLGFRCCECSCILSHWYYEREGQPYCKKHYWARFGEHCHGCKETITTGLIMVTISENAVQLPKNKSICFRVRKILAR